MDTTKNLNPNMQRVVGPDLYQLQDEFDQDDDPDYQKELELMVNILALYNRVSSENPIETLKR